MVKQFLGFKNFVIPKLRTSLDRGEGWYFRKHLKSQKSPQVVPKIFSSCLICKNNKTRKRISQQLSQDKNERARQAFKHQREHALAQRYSLLYTYKLP